MKLAVITVAGVSIGAATVNYPVTRSSRPAPNDQVDVAIERLQQPQHLVDRLVIIRLIEQPVELRR